MTSEYALPPSASRKRYLYGPVIDFLVLGGGGLVLFGICILLNQTNAVPYVVFSVFAFRLTNVFNHPHFAHSYQIFYRDFRSKALGSAYPPVLKARYLVAGIIVPLMMIQYFVSTFMYEDIRMIGYSVNAMFFFVGWHYMKQGYGMMIVDSVLKKAFYGNSEKKLLLYLAYVAWICEWISTNGIFHEAIQNNKDNPYMAHMWYWGIEYFVVPVPALLMNICFAIIIGCATGAMIVFIRKAMRDRADTPYNGMIAYLISIYLWIILARINPIYNLFIPPLHSIQYMAVVWRFEMNKSLDLKKNWKWRLSAFFGIGVALGAAGFVFLPKALDHILDKPAQLKNEFLFLVMVWVFINIHHYFIDNVIWRRENPETKKYLFA